MSFVSLPVLLAQAPTADTNGLLIVGLFFVVIGIGAWLLLRKPRTENPEQSTQRRQAKVEEPSAVNRDARATAKALRRAAKGGIKVTSDGRAERVEALDLAEQQALAQQQAQQAAEQAAIAAAQAEAEAALADAAALAEAAAEQQAREKIRGGLSKTRSEGFVARLGKLFAGKQIDAALLDEIEEVLYRADLGVQATQALLTAIKDTLAKHELSDAERVWQTLRSECLRMLAKVGTGPLDLPRERGPAVLMVIGVNGSGKTTTIGKLAHRYAAQGRKILVAAGDTFRAAAVDQLEVWCERASVDIYRGKDSQDPASVCYAAIERAKAEGYDLVICDTAGRLHTNANLMAELQKVRRVISKCHEGAPDECLLVLDATMGQNAVQQARQFGADLEVSSIALTKLDGTAKGGVVLAIAETLGLPVKLIGVGEQMSDLRDFEPELFVEMLFER